MIYVNEKEVPYMPNMTLIEALSAAGEEVDGMTLLLVDGKVLSVAQHVFEEVEDGTKIKVLRVVSGG
jgi:sulfur carrier protein ThiS